MPSPFPGMNPYLERDDLWHDFHERFLQLAAEVLGNRVKPHYVVRIDEHIHIHEIFDAPGQARHPAMDIEQLAFVQVLDIRTRQVVTVIELLGRSYKVPGPDREQYLVRREQVLASQAHLVEIDLLRCGEPMPAGERPRFDYSALVSRVERRPHAEFWAVGLREPLPVIPIPMRRPDADLGLNLQGMLNRIYDTAGYEDTIYGGEPDPPLSPEDAAWAEAFVPRGK
jgi:hypothetical protein